jgi:4'-phosphopantetheinyl transferase
VWSPAPARLALDGDEVHVWRASLDVEAACRERLAGTLAADETLRAARFRRPRDRDRFVTGRGILRALLGRYLGMAPVAVTLAYGPAGKPFTPGSDVAFSVAHSDGLALLAFARGRAVGVDVERRDPARAELAVAERFFSRGEVAMLHALPPARRPDAFFALWVHKEAYVKATGEGLAAALDRFTVRLDPGGASLVDAPSGWSLRTLAPGPGYAGALAFHGNELHLACHDWYCPDRAP